ncbi:MAG: hypothetical protein LCH70_07640 [Proteobacteria bacterium]|nr:hypothetical protein [Pseudomonadota bacterium]
MAIESVATLEYVQIPAEAIPTLRWALLHGLHAIAEIDRSRSHFDLANIGAEVNREACPQSSLACEGDSTRFAEALLWLEHARAVEET